MSDLIFSTTALIALCYFGIATAVARLMPVVATRSAVFALINTVAVWLIFFTGTQSGAWSMLLYIIFLSIFWILLQVAQKTSRHLFLLGFVPPIAWLVFAKSTGLLFFVGLSYMLFRCAHVEWERTPDGRMTMKEIAGSDFQLKADLILLAMGFLGPRRGDLLDQAKVELDPRGNVLATMGQYEVALDSLLKAADLDRELGRGAVRELMVKIFEIIGVRSELADRYRDQLWRRNLPVVPPFP